ncbi:MBL fold metallo-hydrolase [Parvularcula dongshanensis]|uniref:Glyoxylase-like metal-dependent hydrolase (Beta-lactamase superfamily II) n=1 Tax=Parvularcula dongshanensis TaxID=1173995 RepID=A0A840I7C6_9PROT|nr:MBL fold metallo-hydrolase [Parvularcula dongshanensis]MBB4660008.1 glyoxylase-like metal-dependent hydrolase (beta-lactamase superfamily II) [Parvularcula dongshanensis]
MSETAPLAIRILPVTPFQQNCAILRAADGSAAVIDPGGEIDRILATAKEMDARIEKIWLTHGHLDHAAGAMLLKEKTGAIIEGAHSDDAFWLDSLETVSAQYGFPGDNRNCTPDRWLDEGDTVEIGGVAFSVLHTPGHTPGHVVFFNEAMRLAFVGDVLFKGSIGRTDFPRGDHAALLASVRDKLWPLGDDVRFVPGHGPMSTLGEERRTNPFVGGSAAR